MTLQQLRYVLAALEHGSFSAAAEALHMAQPSLSEQVRALEAELGVSLFERVGRGVVPTAAAQALRPHAQDALEAAEAARASVVEVRELRGGTAAFGLWSHSHYYGTTDIAAEFRHRHPEVRLRLLGQNSAEVTEQVRMGNLELGIIALPIDDAGLDVRPIFRDELVYISVEEELLREPVTIERVAEAALILPDAVWGPRDPVRRQLAERAQLAGVTIDPVLDVEDEEAALDLAGRGLGATVTSRGVLLHLGRRVSRRLGWAPFEEPLLDTMAVITRRGARLSPAAREFSEIAETHLSEVATRLDDLSIRRSPGGSTADRG